VIKTAEHHKYTARQYFLKEGPLAFLPLPDGLCSIVWSMSPKQAKKLKNCSEAIFITELQKYNSSMGTIQAIDKRLIFPLASSQAKEYSKSRLVLMGDAAHTVHPLAGQGVNMGLLDAAALAEVILNSRQFDHFSTLRRYERWRKTDNATMVVAMDSLQFLFSQHNSVLCWGRNYGLTLTNAMQPVKNYFMYQAMGLSNALPKSAKAKKVSFI
jgi:2-octaprenylphenol hydroxylase